MKRNGWFTQWRMTIPLWLIVTLVFSACEAQEPIVVTEPPAGAVEAPPAAEGITETVGTDTEPMTAGADLSATETVTAVEGVTETTGITAADDITTTEDVSETGMTPGGGVIGAQEAFVSASRLLDYAFENRDGEVSGQIEGLLIDLQAGRVLFTSIEYGGFLEIGDTELPVPLNAFAVGPSGELVLNFAEQELENFPDVGADWPDLTGATWDDEVSAFWRDIGIAPGVDVTEATPMILWVSGLLGIPTVDIGLGEGSVQDLIINLGTGRVRYVVLAPGPTVPAGTELVEAILVPVSVLDFSHITEGLALQPDIEVATLQEAPRVDPALYLGADPLDPTFDDELAAYWNEQGFAVEPATE